MGARVTGDVCSNDKDIDWAIDRGGWDRLDVGDVQVGPDLLRLECASRVVHELACAGLGVDIQQSEP